jgi:predicted Zn finger-like uncharacterized protein
MAFSVTCPECRAILKSANPVPAGKKVKCPKCGTAFEAPAQEEGIAVGPGPAPSQEPDDPEVAEVAPPVEDRDDEPRPRKRRDESEQDGEGSRKKRRRDEEPEDEDPSIAGKPKRRKSGMGMTLAIVLIFGGGFVAIVGCVGCGGLGYWLYRSFGPHPIVGTWDQVNAPAAPTRLIFQSDGRGSRQALGVRQTFRYKVEDSNLEIQFDPAPPGQMVFLNLNPVSRFNVTFNGNEMTLVSQGLLPLTERFHRAN